MTDEYEYLRPYAKTLTQRQALDSIRDHGGVGPASRILGKNRRTFARVIERMKNHATMQGYSPEHDMTHTVPEGFVVKGVSTYYNDEGKPTGQWVKSEAQLEKLKELMSETVEAMSERIVRAKPIKPPKHVDSDILNTYVITDYHFGMLAWKEETGAGWDLEIAEKTLINWFQKAISEAPKSEVAVFAQLGDMLHFDSYVPATPASGHILDASSRLQEVIRCVIRVTRQIINMLLQKHSTVHIKWCDANHDPTGSAWMRELLTALYESEPRVEVDNSPDTYYCYEFGLTALFFHHGHKRKMSDVDTVFAAKFRDVFGRTKHSYAHMGHYHHIDVKETNLMVVEQHRTLAAADAYASKGGWISGRESSVIVYHKEFGQVARNTISFDMVAT